MTHNHLRDEWVAEALDAADDEELWRQQRTIDLGLERDQLRAIAERAHVLQVFAEWERERHADDMTDEEWRRTSA